MRAASAVRSSSFAYDEGFEHGTGLASLYATTGHSIHMVLFVGSLGSMSIRRSTVASGGICPSCGFEGSFSDLSFLVALVLRESGSESTRP